MPVREFLKDVPMHFYNGKHRSDDTVCHTVSDVIEQLKKLPPDLPVAVDDEPVSLTIYNAMQEHDHVDDEDIHLTFEGEIY